MQDVPRWPERAPRTVVERLKRFPVANRRPREVPVQPMRIVEHGNVGPIAVAGVGPVERAIPAIKEIHLGVVDGRVLHPVRVAVVVSEVHRHLRAAVVRKFAMKNNERAWLRCHKEFRDKLARVCEVDSAVDVATLEFVGVSAIDNMERLEHAIVASRQ